MKEKKRASPFTMVEGRDILELSTMVKGDSRFFSFIVREDDEGDADKFALSEKARFICLFR